MGFGGGGGGGGAGAVDYPTYMKTWHTAALGTESTFVGKDMATLLAAKIGNSPFTTLTAYDPAAPVAEMSTYLTSYKTLCQALTGVGDWTNYIAQAAADIDLYIFDEASVDDAIAAFNDQVDADLATSVLPRFRRGMQDINAVNTSFFVTGEALIEAEALREKNKFAADLRLQNHKERTSAIMTGVEAIIKICISQLEANRALLQSSLEKNRLELIAGKENADQDIHLSELDGRWDMEMWGYGGNLLAAIGSASVRTGQQTSPGMSALGAGISGLGAVMSLAALLI